MWLSFDTESGQKPLYVYYLHTHTCLTALCPGLPGWAGTRKVKPIWILLKQDTVSGSGISWAICKSAPRSRLITTPAPHSSVFTGRMPFLPPNQQRQSTEGKCILFAQYFCFSIFYFVCTIVGLWQSSSVVDLCDRVSTSVENQKKIGWLSEEACQFQSCKAKVRKFGSWKRCISYFAAHI